MAYRVTFDRPALRALGATGLSRAALVLVPVNVRYNLEHAADQFRGDRDPADPSRFLHTFILADAGRLHRLEFGVNDTATPGEMRVESVRHTPGGPFP